MSISIWPYSVRTACDVRSMLSDIFKGRMVAREQTEWAARKILTPSEARRAFGWMSDLPVSLRVGLEPRVVVEQQLRHLCLSWA